MIQITPQMRLLVAVAPADFRQGIDGLARVCRESLGDPFAGTVFVFRNRRGTAIKILAYDGQGFWRGFGSVKSDCRRGSFVIGPMPRAARSRSSSPTSCRSCSPAVIPTARSRRRSGDAFLTRFPPKRRHRSRSSRIDRGLRS